MIKPENIRDYEIRTTAEQQGFLAACELFKDDIKPSERTYFNAICTLFNSREKLDQYIHGHRPCCIAYRNFVRKGKKLVQCEAYLAREPIITIVNPLTGEKETLEL